MNEQLNAETVTAIGQVLAAHEARINVTFAGQNGDLPDTVAVDATDEQVRTWVTEALRAGSIPGIPAQPGADISDFVVDRFGPTDARPWNMLAIRPKTPFGASRQ